MTGLKSLWSKLLRAVGVGRPRRPHWIEPANTITRAIDQGRPLVTMATWDPPSTGFVPAAKAPMPAEAAAQDVPLEPAAPKRPGVAA